MAKRLLPFPKTIYNFPNHLAWNAIYRRLSTFNDTKRYPLFFLWNFNKNSYHLKEMLRDSLTLSHHHRPTGSSVSVSSGDSFKQFP